MILRLLLVIPFLILTTSYLYLFLTSHHVTFLNNNNINKNTTDVATNNAYTISYSQPENDQELIRLGLTPKPSILLKSLNGKSQKIHGRFLHITDMHPDEFYKMGSSIDEACHHGHGKGDDIASKYGDAVKGCDSPKALVEGSLEWISENLKDKIDFVVWTGDNIRHDNDRRHPRLEQDIFQMNERIAEMVHETFSESGDDTGSESLKIIPSLGNNDVYPHNLFSPGPTLQTRELYKIWKDFVPSEQLHIFARGAYYFSEIIPNKLAVLSINTLYLFRSNPLVDNCDNKKEPGYKLFEWLGYTLRELRSRGMKVWLTGHVPPTPKNYDPTCLRKHIVWLYEYRDIIVGSLYGHMNIDHFIPLDAQKAYKSINKTLNRKNGLKGNNFVTLDYDTIDEEDDDFADLEEMNSYLNIDTDDEIFGSEPHIMGGAPMGKVEYMESIRDTFYSRVKGVKNRGLNSERYSIAHISSSIVPTFNPGIRVWEYNITGLFDTDIKEAFTAKPWDKFFTDLDTELFSKEEEEDLQHASADANSKKDKTFPPKMPLGTPLGPAYTPQVFSPQRYVQYYVDLAHLNTMDNDTKLEYEIEYTSDDDYYQLETLLVDDWVKFARKLGEPVKVKRDIAKGKKVSEMKGKKENKLENLWKLFLNRSFINTGYENMKEYN